MLQKLCLSTHVQPCIPIANCCFCVFQFELGIFSFSSTCKTSTAHSSRGGVEDTTLEAKDTKKKSKAKDRSSRDQEEKLSRPRTKDTGGKCSPKKRFFKQIFLAISKKSLQKHFSGDLQNFNDSKNSVVLELRTGKFSKS